MKPHRQRVLVIEDNPTTLKGLTLFLTAEGYEVKTALNGRVGLEIAANCAVDIILLDLMLPDLSGLEICQSVRQASDIPIVILSARTTEQDVVQGLELGADDYVRKPFGSSELLARIRRCLDRRAVCGEEEVVQLADIELALGERQLKVQGTPISLTKSEFEILRVLLSKPGHVFTRGELIDRALGTTYNGFDRTIDTHIWSLRKKLGEVRGHHRYILSEPGIGYRMNHDP